MDKEISRVLTHASKLLNNQKFSSILPLLENGFIINDPKQQGNILNQHFSTKSSVPGSDDEVPILEQKQCTSSLNNITTNPLQTAKTIQPTLKKSNLSHCGVSEKFLGLIATPISFSLSCLLNNHFEEGYFPDIWKLSHITAIWKHKSLKSDKSMYCPISLLPKLSKIYESIFHQELLRHC